jgi:hypothetical protein
MPNMGIEIEVYRDIAPFAKVDVLDGRVEPTLLREIEGVGAGSFKIAKSDAKIVDDPTLIDYRNFFRVRVNGKIQGGFILNNKEHTIVGKGEKAEEAWQISGEGLRSWGKDATVNPARPLSPFSSETRYFNFASEQGAWYNPSDWTPATIVNPWGAASANWRGTAPSNWPDAPQANWIWDRNAASYQMPQGFVYFRFEINLAQKGQYALFFAVDDAAEVYVDGDLVHTTAEHAWEETTRQDFDLDAGWHVFAFKAYNYQSDGPGSLIAALYKIGDANAPMAATLLAVTDSSWKICAYPEREPGWTVGNILLTLLQEAKDRGVRFAKNWTPMFSHTHDSAGVPWASSISISFSLSTNYEEVFTALEEAACDIYLDAETLQLYVWAKRGADRSLEGPASANDNPIVLNVGHNLITADEKGQADIVNSLLLRTADGWERVQSEDTDSIAKYGVLEGQVSTEMSSKAASDLVAKVFEKKALPEKTATFEMIPVPNMVPLEDFEEGDWVSAPGETRKLEKRRIMSVSVTENKIGDPTYAVEFDNIFGSRTDDLMSMISKAAGMSALSGGFAGTSPTPSTPTQGGPPQLPVAASPLAPAGLEATSTGRWTENGTAVSDVKLTWLPVISNVNNLPVTDIYAYEVWGRKGSDEFARLTTVENTISNVIIRPGEAWEYRVRAVSRTGGYGNFSVVKSVTGANPSQPLPKPSTPTLVSKLGAVGIFWDGQLGGSAAPTRYKHMEVQRATSSSGPWTLVTSLVTGSATDSTGTAGTTYWYRLVPIDYVGVAGAPSSAASITVVGVATDDIDAAIKDAIDEANATADSALASADGKNRITYSSADPTGTGTRQGDLWYKLSGDLIIGVWTWTGTQWIKRTIDGQTVDNLDAGKVTAGVLNADRIAAKSILASKLLLATLDNLLDNADLQPTNKDPEGFDGWVKTGNSPQLWKIQTSGAAAIDHYITREPVSGTGSGSLTNTFRAAVRAGQRLRMDMRGFFSNLPATTWVPRRRNYASDPLALNPNSFRDVLLAELSRIDNMTGGVSTGVRIRRAATGTMRVGIDVGTPNKFPTETEMRVRMRVRASVQMTAALRFRPVSSDSTTGETPLGVTFTIPAGSSAIDVSGITKTTAATANGAVVLLIDGGAVGDTLDMSSISVETAAQAALGDPFAGSTTSTNDAERWIWAGTPNASQSIYQTRTGYVMVGPVFYRADGTELSHVSKIFEGTSVWADFTWETVVPNDAFFASLRIVDTGYTGAINRYANLAMRLMSAAELIVDGTIVGRQIAAETITSANIAASTIQVDRLVPNAGSVINLEGNTQINALNLGADASQAALASQQQRVTEAQEAAAKAAAAASQANSATQALSGRTDGLQAGIQTTQTGLADLGRTYRFTAAGAFIGAPGSAYEFVIQNTGAEIRYNGQAVSSWDAGQFIVNSFVGTEVVLGNHKLEKDPATGGTVVRKIVGN